MGECDMKNEMKKWTYVPILGIVAGELLIFNGNVLSGLGIHIINFLIIVFMIIFGNLNTDIKNVLQGLILVALLRVVNLSMPQFFTTTLIQYPLMYGVMFIPLYNTVKSQQISVKELGIDFKKMYIYLPVAVLIGIMMAIVEYRILSPVALIDNVRFSNIALITIIMIVFIGTVEEIIFGPILQTRLAKVFGLRYGILLTGVMFGIMHSTYGIVNEILFATIFGIILGYIFQKTKSLPFTVSILGVTNIMLFGILPSMRFI